ncbi:MAG: glycosyltransferase family 4 protein [Acidobacteriota bacterium]
MKIALLCHKFWPAVGGLCTYTWKLAEFLVGRGHKVQVFTSKVPVDSPARETIDSALRIYRFNPRLAKHIPFYFMPGLLSPAQLNRLWQSDLVHSVGYYFSPALLGHLVSRLSGSKYVSTVVFTRNPESWQRAWFDRLVGRQIVRGADHVILQSRREKDLVQSRGFTLPAHSIIPFGVDAAAFRRDYDVTSLRTRTCESEEEKVLLFVGRIISTKGSFRVLEAVKRARDRGLAVRLVMMGELVANEKEAFCRRRLELRLERAVTMTGVIHDEVEKARYYQMADAVVFPSQYEQFGMVAIEAVASGCPLLGTPVGIMQDIVPRFGIGLLHPFEDVERFAMNIREVLEENQFRLNATKHRGYFLEKYSWARIVEQTEALFQELIQQ